MSSVSHLDPWDYASLSITVLGSCAVGLYHVCAARKATNAKQFLVSSHDLGLLPLILSIMATQMSAITMLGYTAESYVHGLSFSILVVATLIGIPIGSHLFLPVFFKVATTSIFEYLELRFCKTIRLCSSIMWTLRMMITNAIVMYAPALALNQVTGLHLWASVVTIGAICIAYTSLGGIKAVVWADVLQCLVMLAVMVTIVVKGTFDVGGLDIVWQRLEEGKRDEIFIWSSSPHSRYSFWTMTIGGSTHMVMLITLSQSYMQRYLSSRTLRQSQISYIVGALGVAFCYLLLCVAGVVMYAYYHTCDPLLDGRIKLRDQSLALFALDILSFGHGLSGVFVGGLMCATLSTLSSILNSMAAITLSDYIKVFKPDLSNEASMKLSKILVVLYGLLSMALVSLAENMGGVLMATYSILAITGGSFLAVFTSGMLLPWVNSKGAAVGMLCSIVVPLWAWIGNLVTSPPQPHAPLSTIECSNWTTIKNSTINSDGNFLQQFYSMSTFWYASWSLAIGLVVSLVISKLTGFQDASEVDADLLFPFVSKYIRRHNNLDQKTNRMDNIKGQAEIPLMVAKETIG